MTSILSSISGQFSKSLILGTFFPVALFVILGRIFLIPLFPTDWPLLRPLEALGTEWQVLALSLLTIVISGLLYNLNSQIVRFYEGYPWKNSWIGKRRTHFYQTQFAAIYARWRGMRTLKYTLACLRPNEPSTQEINTQWEMIAGSFNKGFPPHKRLVLPTRLGNVIRSFESYPTGQYGMDAIILWPRLIAKIDKDYAPGISDARSSFDFMVNCSMLSAILALAILLAGVVYPSQFYPSLTASIRKWLPWLIEILIFGLLAYICYLSAIFRASAWGSMVKSAFDLYRWDLLKQLGYTRVPATMAEERILWRDISLQMFYGDSPNVQLADYTGRSTIAQSNSPEVMLTVVRGVSASDSQNGSITVTLGIQNSDSENRNARNVVVTDTPPDGFDYEWASARIDNKTDFVPVLGVNPYQFQLGDLKAGDAVILTYRALPRKK